MDPNTHSCNVAIAACGMPPAQYEQALMIYDHMQMRDMVATSATYDIVMHACGRLSEWARALEIMENAVLFTEPNADSYDVAIMACGIHGHWRLALDYMDRMEEQDLEPCGNSYNTLLQEFVQGDSTVTTRERSVLCGGVI